MLQSILHITGIDQKLQALKDRIEDQAQGLIRQSKAVAVQMATAAVLALAAVMFAVLALVAALITLFFWLEPQFGSIAAMAIVAGGLMALSGILAISTVMFARGSPSVESDDAGRAGVDHQASESRALAVRTPADDVTGALPVGVAAPQVKIVNPQDADSILSLVQQFVRMPKTGISPVDEALNNLAPKAEEATREAVARAANLVRYGDRSTMLAILGTALAIGWAVTKLDRKRTAQIA